MGSAVYFSCLGLAFLFIELAVLARITLLLGNPVYAAAATLASFLIFAGMGSSFSARWSSRGSAPARAAASVAVVAVLHTAVMPFLLPSVSHWATLAKLGVAVATVAPLAFVMGMPFPLGLSLVAKRAERWIPWAWGLNGFASVWSAASSIIVAMHFGFTVLALGGAVLYAVAAWAARSWGTR